VMNILAIQPSSKCDSNCLACPWKEKFSCVGVMLPPEALEVLTSNLEDFKFDEGILICPNPLLHPKIDVITRETGKLCRKIVLFLPVSVSRSFLHKTSLENVDFISLIIPSYKDLKSNLQTVKMLLSQGIDNLEAYILLDFNSDFAELFSIIDLCKSYGLKIILGPSLYTSPYADKFLEKIVKKENVEIGLHYGRKYFYNAIKIFIDNYPVTLLTSPSAENCRTLYLNPYGNFSKCPLSKFEVNYKRITRKDLRKMLFSPCPVSQKVIRLSPKIQVSFVTKEGVEIPGEVLELLELISQINSFRAACKVLGVSPSTYWEKIKSLEEKLDISLIISVRGGRKKGATILTEFAKELLNEYREVREKAIVSLYED